MFSIRFSTIEFILTTSLILILMQCVCSELFGPKIYPPTSTLKPYIRTKGLSLPIRNKHPPKCMREVPAIFAQYEKDVEIIGNSTDNRYFNIIEVCCKGYKRYEYDWSQCVPDCGDKCIQNAFCLAGGVCQCFNDFMHNHRNECVPTCPVGCPNGDCYLNGTCICHKNYELDATKRVCLPKCELGCGHNEICAEPGKCECIEGYARAVPDLAGMGCQPVCIPDCGYGRCIAPNQCECFLGYQQRLNSSTCEANCYMRCENGFCVNRTMCACQNGYKYDNLTTSCLPDCLDECENGVCISPGVCRCFNGYIRKGVKCEALCNKGCGAYGKCIAPNKCGCSIVDGPVRTYQQCEYGFCNSEGHCQCEEGKTRFLNKCMETYKVNTYASTMPLRILNITFIEEFNYVIGKYFQFGIEFPRYYLEPIDRYNYYN